MLRKLIIDRGSLIKTAADLPGEGPSFLQQFGILANAQITDKYPMLSNYQISVQLIDKTDDNSFAVCVIVYKLGKNFIYVPAVFRNGKIDTGLFMEIPSLQMFLPLSDAWMSWVKNKDIADSGLLILSSLKDLYGNSPSTARTKLPVDPLTKTSSIKTASLFDTALKLGKTASEKLLNYLCNNDYLNASFKFYTPDLIDNFAKQASLKFQDLAGLLLINALDKSASYLTLEQKAALFIDGFLIKKALKIDWGPAENDLKVMKSSNIRNIFRAPEKACKCQALSQQGKLIDITYIPIIKDEYHCCRYDDSWYPKFSPGKSKFITSAKKSISSLKSAITVSNKVYKNIPYLIAALLSSIQDLDVSSLGKSFGLTTEARGNIVLVFPNKTAMLIHGSFYKDDKTGLLVSYNKAINLSEDESLVKPIYNDDYIEVPKGTRILLDSHEYSETGSRLDWLKKEDIPTVVDTLLPIKISELDRAITKFTDTKYKSFKVTSDGQEISIEGLKSKSSDRMQKKEAVLHLVKDYGVSPKDAKLIIKLAGAATPDHPKTTGYYLYKLEALGQLSDIYQPADIGYNEIPNVPPQVTQEDLNGKPQMDLQLLMDTITRATLAGVKLVFDTSTLKLLVQDADPHELILDSLPDFMKTLDKLCRLLFIYRTHMLDMEERYGSVKMKALLKSLQNTIKDLSLLAIFLKLRGLNNGEAPDAGDLQTGTLMQ